MDRMVCPDSTYTEMGRVHYAKKPGCQKRPKCKRPLASKLQGKPEYRVLAHTQHSPQKSESSAGTGPGRAPDSCTCTLTGTLLFLHLPLVSSQLSGSSCHRSLPRLPQFCYQHSRQKFLPFLSPQPFEQFIYLLRFIHLEGKR